MLYCSLIQGLTYLYILNNRNALQMSKFSFGDTRKVTISQDVKTNKTPDSDEKEDGDLMNSWTTKPKYFVLQDLLSYAFSLW